MHRRASLLLLTLPLAALSVACGDSGGLPTGSWHPYTGTTGGGGGTASSGAGGTGSNGATNGGSSSSGGSATNGSTSSGGSSSSGGGSTSGSSGASSSGSGSSGASSSSSGSSTQPTPDLGVTLDQSSMTSQLMASNTVHVSVAPNGFVGMANLTLPSMPSGVTGTFDNAVLALDGRTTATATLTLQTADSAPPGAANVEVDATAMGANTGKATIALTVESVITVHIPMGVNNLGGTTSNPVTTAYGPYPIKIAEPTGGISAQNPVTVYFFNDDSVPHEIHASDDQEGFAHDPGLIPPMSMDSLVRKVNTAGSYNFYLHDQNAPITVGLIEIQ